jgi:vesicular inhibitory amino acid transporter
LLDSLLQERKYQSAKMSLGMTPQPSFSNLRVLEPLVHGVASSANLEIPGEVKHGGLGVITAAIFLAGEMAGSGVLALPNAMVGTGWFGLVLILLFTMNAGFSGTRLGLCWIMLEERYEEFRGEVRDPYPAIAEKAVGRWGRIASLVAISLTLYGGGCVFIVLIAQLLGSLASAAGFQLSLCVWMVIVAAGLTPLTWMGTPKDFWPIAVGALITTCIACILVIVTCVLDGTQIETKVFPAPTYDGLFKAFGSIMFAFAGASTFPTIQADMKDRSKFNYSAVMAMGVLFLVYFPMAAACYFSLGDQVTPNIVLAMSDGWERIIVEIMLLLHLITAYPIITNPPAQFFEQMLNIPSDFNWKRCAFRSISVACLLFIAESVPSFGAILDLVGASTVTLLTFIFPPYFYMRLADASLDRKEWVDRKLPLWERIYCWVLIIIGLAGGVCATVIAVRNIVGGFSVAPCYMMTGNITIAAGGH